MSSSAKTTGTGNPTTKVSRLMDTVFQMAFTAMLVLKKASKCLKIGSAQGLPIIPILPLKSLKAISSPYMG